jgi:hypothetical protein
MEDGRNDTEGLFNMDEEEEEDKGYIARYDNNTKSVPQQIPNITESDKSCSLFESVLDQNYTGIVITAHEII